MDLIPSRTFSLASNTVRTDAQSKIHYGCEGLSFPTIFQARFHCKYTLWAWCFCVLFVRLNLITSFCWQCCVCVCVQMVQITPSEKQHVKQCEGKISEWKIPRPTLLSKAFLGAIVSKQQKSLRHSSFAPCCSVAFTKKKKIMFIIRMMRNIFDICAVYVQCVYTAIIILFKWN